MREISVSTGRPYTVFIGPGLLENCGEQLAAAIPPCRAMLVADSTVKPLYAPAVKKNLTRAGFAVSLFSFSAGERSKSMSTLARLLERMARAQLTRGDCLVALGGGVAGDLGGFAAGCYLRGIRFAQLPTTLLAAVDSSVGGKTAVNLAAGKNLAGLFWQPAAVVCDTACLATLPGETLLGGAAEAIKTAVLDGEALFSRFEQGDFRAHLEEIIARCVAFKARVVAEDEREHGPRKTLNLGHTLGHAVEACSGYTVPHGQAVAIGLAMITRAAAAMGVCEAGCARRIIRVLRASGLPVQTEFSADALLKAALHDKKRAGDTITLVLPRAIGDCVLHTVPVGELAPIITLGKETLP